MAKTLNISTHSRERQQGVSPEHTPSGNLLVDCEVSPSALPHDAHSCHHASHASHASGHAGVQPDQHDHEI
jgi:hypothetical protein